MEIPIAFPLSEPHPRLYVVDDVKGIVRPAYQQKQAQKPGRLDSKLLSTTTENNSRSDTYSGSAPLPSSSSSSTTNKNDYGSASVSNVSIHRPSTTQNQSRKFDDVLVITSPVIGDNCHIVAVSIINTRDINLPLEILHFDLGSASYHYQITVKIQAFSKQNGKIIQLSFIDCNGYVLTIDISVLSSLPSTSEETVSEYYFEPCPKVVRFVSIGRDILNAAIRDRISSITIRSSSMVLFLSSTTILIALNPFLIAIDLHNKVAIQWSKTVCLEEMNIRRKSKSTASGIVGAISDLFSFSSSVNSTGTSSVSSNTTTLLLSKSKDGIAKKKNHIIVDMNPVSAIVMADNDPKQIFTLHSDCTIRRWVIVGSEDEENEYFFTEQEEDDNNSDKEGGRPEEEISAICGRLKPYDVYDLQVYPQANGKNIPSPETWIDDVQMPNNSICMAARMYDHGKIFVLAIGIHTRSTMSSDTMGVNNHLNDTNSSLMIAAPSLYGMDESTSFDGTNVDETEYEVFGVSANNDNNRLSSSSSISCRLVVLDGRIQDVDGYDVEGSSDIGLGLSKVHCISLGTPANVSALVGMSFDRQQDRCSIKALFNNAAQPESSSTQLVVASLLQQTAANASSFDPEIGNGNAVLVLYPPSNISIVYREPQICYSVSHLSSIAKDEYLRIKELSFYHSMKDTFDISIDDAIHAIDRRYMQYLFRPTFVRGNGTILPPSAAIIRQALDRRCNMRQQSQMMASIRYSDCSIEVQVLQVMASWRNSDLEMAALAVTRNRKNNQNKQYGTGEGRIVQFAQTPMKNANKPSKTAMMPMTPTAATVTTPQRKTYPKTPIPPRSIYQSLQKRTGNYDSSNESIAKLPSNNQHSTQNMDIDTITKYTANKYNKTEREGAVAGDNFRLLSGSKEFTFECKLHENRWRQLLLDVWNAEERIRCPLTLYIPPKRMLEDSVLILRAGCTSVIPIDKQYVSAVVETQETGRLNPLDNLAANLIGIIEANLYEYSALKVTERFVFELIASGRISIEENIFEIITDRLKMAVSESVLALLDTKECQSDVSFIEKLTDEELMHHLLREPLNSGYPGLDILSNIAPNFSESPNHVILPEHHVRVAATGLFARTAQTMCSLYLSRFLVVSELLPSEIISVTAMRMYLQMLTTLWVSSQVVPMPKLSDRTDELATAIVADIPSPPKKRVSIGNGSNGILPGNTDKTTCLDCKLVHLLRKMGKNQFSQSLSAHASSLAQAAILSIFSVSTKSTEQPPSFASLPELNIILTSKNSANGRGDLILRLLAPFHTRPNINEASEVNVFREDLLAKALLEASSTDSNDKIASIMVQKAFTLLQFKEYDIQNGMNRVYTLSVFASKNERVAKEFLRFIEAALNSLDSRPEETYPKSESLKAYAHLWSILFHTAVRLHKWDNAFNACINNPMEGERISNCRRLVVAMVDSGALNELHELCVEFNVDSSTLGFASSFQALGSLYGIAIEELTEMSRRDLYSQLAVDSLPPSDYNGALYTLFVARKNWKYAAQAMDLRFINAIDCLSKRIDTLELTEKDFRRRESAIIDALANAAIGCAEAMLNNANPHEWFLVSGEGYQVPSIPVDIATRIQAKRGRGSSDPSITFSPGAPISRLERYLNLSDIETRAMRYNAIKVLFHDPGCDYAFVKSSALNRNHDIVSDQSIVAHLFEFGYYDEGLSLAASSCKRFGSNPAGKSIFYNELAHLTTTFLVPLAIGTVTDIQRPTLNQLNKVLSSMVDSTIHVKVEQDVNVKYLETRERQRLAMMLIEKLVERYVSAEIPIATDVARTILMSQPSCQQLPNWLERIFIRGTLENSILPGLFSRRRPSSSIKGYLGDPLTLLNLYIGVGLYADSCRIISSILDEHMVHNKKSTSRMPEKGDIDFVPYNKIDLVYNLCEVYMKCENTRNNIEQKAKLQKAQSLMVSSLENHFQFLTLNQQGIKSARVLALN